ncbi:MAG: hypothetical protein LWX07_00710 [Bacteroidetes bacterium]|nr:hypothetical protein [Bacteroidota bacterium]
MKPLQRKSVLFMLLLLFFHAAHILEEVWGRFWPVGRYYSMEVFIILNLVLFAVPLVFFYYFLAGKRWAVYMCLVYGAIMILNGLGHNIATIVTGRYFGGFAGGFSGIGLIFSGIPVVYYMRANLKAIYKGKQNG